MASTSNIFMFEYRGSSSTLRSLVSICGRKSDGHVDGVRMLYNILEDAVRNHGITNLKIPKRMEIRLKGRTTFLLAQIFFS